MTVHHAANYMMPPTAPAQLPDRRVRPRPLPDEPEQEQVPHASAAPQRTLAQVPRQQMAVGG